MGGKNKAKRLWSRIRQRRRTHAARRSRECPSGWNGKIALASKYQTGRYFGKVKFAAFHQEDLVY